MQARTTKAFKILARQLLKAAKRQPREAVEIVIDELRQLLAAQVDAPQGSYVQEMVNCGKAKCRTCAPGKPSHGPYWFFYWTEAHKTRKKYIGKRHPDQDDEDDDGEE